jgi:hypothetical protein
MSDDADDDPHLVLTRAAEHLDRIRRPRLLRWPFYDPLADAVVWTDEMRWLRMPGVVVSALRGVWCYRTSLMLGKPREDCAADWALGLEKFPNWVGFRPARRVATPRLLRIYRAGNLCVRKQIREWEREME